MSVQIKRCETTSEKSPERVIKSIERGMAENAGDGTGNGSNAYNSQALRAGGSALRSKSLNTGSSIPLRRYYSATPLWTDSISGIYGYAQDVEITGSSLNLMLEQGLWTITVTEKAPDGKTVYEGSWTDYVNPNISAAEINLLHKVSAGSQTLYGNVSANFTAPARGSAVAEVSVYAVPVGGGSGSSYFIDGELSSDGSLFSFSTSVNQIQLVPGFYTLIFTYSDSIGIKGGQVLTVEVLNGQTAAIGGDLDTGLFIAPASYINLPVWTSGEVTVLSSSVFSGDSVTASVPDSATAAFSWYVNGQPVLTGSSNAVTFTAPAVITQTSIQVWCYSSEEIWYKGAVNVQPASWFAVTFETNGHGDTCPALLVRNSAEITMPVLSEPNWVFGGWYEDPSFSGSPVPANVQVSSDMIYYAKWTGQTYTVTYNANGGSGTMSPGVFTGGVQITLAENTFTRDGWTFAGWALEPSGSAVYGDQAPVPDLSVYGTNVDLYAVWTQSTFSYQITFYPNGPAESPVQQTLVAGVSMGLSLNRFTYQGRAFSHWNTKADGTGVSYADGEYVSQPVGNASETNPNAELYACWIMHEYRFFANSGYSLPASEPLTGENCTNIYYKYNGVNMGRVGGVVFYINANSLPGEDRYYVMIPNGSNRYNQLEWGSYNTLQNLGEEDRIGSGKIISRYILEHESDPVAGKCFFDSSNDRNTIWYKLKYTINTTGINDQRDWYIGSKAEYTEAMRISSNYTTNLYNIFFSYANNSANTIWTANEVSETNSTLWQRGWISTTKSSRRSLVPIRSF